MPISREPGPKSLTMEMKNNSWISRLAGVMLATCKEEGKDVCMYGETGRTGKMRCSEHRDALVDPRKSSNLREHCQNFHDGRF